MTQELPIGHDGAREAASKVLDAAGADDVDVLVAGSRTAVTRYANSEIIQNLVREEIRAQVRVVVGDRHASATTNQLDAASLERTAARAIEAANASRPDAGFPGLADPDQVGRAESIFRFDAPTATATPSRRADAVKAIVGTARADNAAGIFETSAHCYGVFSSRGIDCFDAFSRCSTTCLVDLGGATGWEEDSSFRMDDVDTERLARAARAKADASIEARDADPGTYEVVLEAPAVGALVEYLSYMGFGAKQVIEGESFLSARQGEMVAEERVTASDDVYHPRSVGIGFDFEGVPKQRVPVIEGGRAQQPVTDLKTSRKLGLASTGHYSGSEEFGPYAANVVLEAGERSLEEMIAAVDDGLLVTRFHYVNVLDRPETLLTGMTRDGTFRIRRGELAEPVRNFRFSQSVLDALSSVRGVGRDVRSFAPEYGGFGSTVAPALHVGAFRFTSRTSH